MQFRKTILIFITFICISQLANAQWDAQISQYWNMKNYYNPSYIGTSNFVETAVMHRRQWVGVTHAPVSNLISANMPLQFLGKEHGVGILVLNESIGLFSNTSFYGQYAYKFKFKKNRLHIGLQGGMVNLNFDASKIHIPTSEYHDPLDPAIPTGKNNRVIDGGLGASWIAPKYYISLGVNHLWNPKFDVNEEYTSYIARAYYLMGGYNIRFKNSLFELQPSAFFKTDAVTTQLDLTMRLEYARFLNGGISWRKDDSVVFLLGVKIKSFEAGYSYDLSTSAISAVSNGSHEFVVRFKIPIVKSKHREGLKSIRIL